MASTASTSMATGFGHQITNCIKFFFTFFFLFTISLIVGVDGPLVYHVLFSGDVTVKMPATPLRVYSLCLQKKNEVLLYFSTPVFLKVDVELFQIFSALLILNSKNL